MVRVRCYAFRERGLPVVNVAGGAPDRTGRTRHGEPFQAGWTDFIPELNQQPSDIVVTKRSRGAFGSTHLEGFSQSGNCLRAHLPRR
jgi:hypothetical protein